MKALLIIALALVASAYAYEVDDIPEFMRERLDKYIALRNEWEQKWHTMSQEDRDAFEQMIYERLSHIPDHVKLRIHNRITEMPAEDRVKLRDYLYQRFPELEETIEAEDEIEEIDEIIEKLPEILREKISDFIAVRFAPAKAYENTDDTDFVDFPDIPELISIPQQGDGVPYTEEDIEEVRRNVDNFLVKREEWKRRWENLPEEKREAFERYIEMKTKN